MSKPWGYNNPVQAPIIDNIYPFTIQDLSDTKQTKQKRSLNIYEIAG